MIDINNFDAIEISLASSKQIRSWSSGEVTKPETINYRTLKPEKDGLFCERIFGPTKDWECYCGKYKRVRYKGIVCERCGVEVTRSKVRRERMGHVDLAAPVSHIWFFKGVPSRIGYLLDMAPKELEKVLYFAASIVTWVDDEARGKDLDSLEKEVNKVLDSYAGEREERVLELRESLARREKYLQNGKQTNFNDEDHLWADSLDINLSKISDEEREKQVKELTKAFEADIADTEAYIEDAAERMRNVWELFKTMEPKQIEHDESTFRELKERFGSSYGFGEYFRGGMGAEAIRDLLQQVDLEDERVELEDQVKTGKGQKQARAVKRLKVVSAFIQSGNKPDMMVLDAVPVIPPELRPMVQLDGGRFATSDLNDLYRRVINRNNRLKRLLDLGAPEIIVNNEKRMLQEAVDALFDNGRRGRPVTGPGNRPLKSLSDMLKGKQGRFRQNLLGKRVDYSGRSVIVAGPYLKLHQCGLPKIMALELFKPFIMARLVERKSAQNIKAAKKMVDSMIGEVWDVLEEVIHEHPVLLNRAPTLHRLGIQAFEPLLVEGKAIQVHPLVCHAFNADFDGDQMAVHLPLSAEAQAEARILMLSSNNILSPAHGAPLATPTQDMILGAYYLTYGPEASELSGIDRATYEPRPHVFRTAQEAELSYESGSVKLHDIAEFRPYGREGGHVLTTIGRIIYNDRIERALAEALGDEFDPSKYTFVNQSMKKRDTTRLIDLLVQSYGATTISLVLDAFKDLGFKYATQAGITISKNDVVVPPEKQEILEKFEALVSDITGQYEDGLITQEERHEAVVEQWNAATDEVADAMIENFDKLNPIYMMADSGARGSFKQIRQLAGMRGLMANPKGEIIERPIKANFMEGLSVLEYFISTHGARKGLADTALRTADSGYLTRRLVDVAQDVIIRDTDCGTEEYIEMDVFKDDGEPNDGLVGRIAALPIETKRHRMLAEQGTEIGREQLADIVSAFEEEHEKGTDVKVPVRSVLKCEAPSGVCQACYGRAMATGALAQIGDAVGIVAAQSIGEPGTQLTMRTFHTGGVAGADITHGLPRVVELFEARSPRAWPRSPSRTAPSRSRRPTRRSPSPSPTRPARSTATRSRAGRACSWPTARRSAPAAAQRGVGVPARAAGDPRPHGDRGVPRQGGAGGLQVPGRGHQRQAHRADRPADAEKGPCRPEGRHRLPARPVRRPLRVREGERRGDRQGWRVGAVRGHHPRDHQGVAEHGLVPLGGLLPGDDQGAHRRRARRQDRPPQRAQGERDHRQADPGRDRAQALPPDRDRTLRAAAARDRRRRAARPGRDRGRARPDRRRLARRLLRPGVRCRPRLAGEDRRRRHRPRLRRGARRAGAPRRGRRERQVAQAQKVAYRRPPLRGRRWLTGRRRR